MFPKPHVYAGLLCMALVACSPLRTKPDHQSGQLAAPVTKAHAAFHRVIASRGHRIWRGVHPDLQERLEGIQLVMASEGFDLRTLEGFRSPERQAMLMASGNGVTRAGAWASCHNYGLAVDATVYVDGKPSWNLNDPDVLAGLQRFGEFAEILGLNWGGRWKDPVDFPHVELRSECRLAKWARRHGKPAPAFAATAGQPSSEILMAYVSPTWCFKGIDGSCLNQGGAAAVNTDWFRPARICTANIVSTNLKSMATSS